MNKLIPFHIPYKTKEDFYYLNDALKKNMLSGRGIYTKLCENLLKKNFKRDCLLTTSCTHALEIIAFLLKLNSKDEIIVPSYTFVSTANAFAIRGAKIILADSNTYNPCVSANDIKKKITKNTKAVCIVHYAGISCDMKEILKICRKNRIKLIEDCAHAFDAFSKKKKLGTFGDYAAFSFHGTKNLTSGEGGALLLKNKKEYYSARVILEKGTNRISFDNNKIKKYSWVGYGSSYTPSDLNCSLLYAQLKKRHKIRKKRTKIFKYYESVFSKSFFKKYLETPKISKHSSVSGHIFYLSIKNYRLLKKLINYAHKKNIIFQQHYTCLHKSHFYKKRIKIKLPNSENFEKKLIRLPIYPDLNKKQLFKITNTVKNFFNNIK